MDIKDIFA